MSVNRRHAQLSIRRQRKEMIATEEPVLLALHGAHGYLVDHDEKRAISDLLHLVRHSYPDGPEAVYSWSDLAKRIWDAMLALNRATPTRGGMTDERAYGLAALVEGAGLARAAAARQQTAQADQHRTRRQAALANLNQEDEIDRGARS